MDWKKTIIPCCALSIICAVVYIPKPASQAPAVKKSQSLSEQPQIPGTTKFYPASNQPEPAKTSAIKKTELKKRLKISNEQLSKLRLLGERFEENEAAALLETGVEIELPARDGALRANFRPTALLAKNYYSEASTERGKEREEYEVYFFDSAQHLERDDTLCRDCISRIMLVLDPAEKRPSIRGIYLKNGSLYQIGQNSEGETEVQGASLELLRERAEAAGIGHIGEQDSSLVIDGKKYQTLAYTAHAPGPDGKISKTKNAENKAVHAASPVPDNLLELELATEADYEQFLNDGSVRETNIRLLNLWNFIDAFYERSLGVSIRVVYQHVWAFAGDPYVGDDTAKRLNEFIDYWRTNISRLVQYDAAIIQSGIRAGDANGRAVVSSVCDTQRYGIATLNQSNTNPKDTFTQDFFLLTVSAHELGHVLGARHCDYFVDGNLNKLMCGRGLEFHPDTISAIRARISNASCLRSLGVAPTPTHKPRLLGVPLQYEAVEFKGVNIDINYENIFDPDNHLFSEYEFEFEQIAGTNIQKLGSGVSIGYSPGNIVDPSIDGSFKLIYLPIKITDPSGLSDQIIVTIKVFDSAAAQSRAAGSSLSAGNLELQPADNGQLIKAPLLGRSSRDPSTCLNQADTDADGVCDAQEALDGSNSLDPGSFKTVIESPVYALWNGFLRMNNVLELINIGQSKLDAEVSLFRIDGTLGSKVKIPLQAGQQFDLILNNMSGFAADSFGVVVVSFNGELDGRLSYYRLSPIGSYEFGFAVSLSNPLVNRSVVGFNTFQPSLNALDLNNTVANWLSVVNLDAATREFTVRKYNQAGSRLQTQKFSLAPFARIDLEAGHVIPGPFQVGSLEIIPQDPGLPYLAQLYRYGGNTAGALLPSAYAFAFPLSAKVPNGEKQYLSISSRQQGQNWLEIINTRADSLTVAVDYYDSGGAKIKNEIIALAPRAQENRNADSLLGKEENCIVVLTPSKETSLIAQSMYYFRDIYSGMSAMYGTQARELFGIGQFGSYNLFLGMKNYLKITNTYGLSTKVTLSFSTFDSASQLAELSRYTYRILPFQTIELPVHDSELFNTSPDTYGVIGLSPNREGVILAEVIRALGGSANFEFAAPTEVR